MTQRLRGIDNIRKAMERRMEEREDVVRLEADHAREAQDEAPAGKDGKTS